MAKFPYRAPKRSHYDIVVVGGAVIGSAVAYWLTENPDFQGSILVVERDSTYEFSSTALSTSAIRQQYSNPINVKISQFGAEFLHGFRESMQKFYHGEQAPDLGFKENGYIYCTSPEGVAAARERVELQRSLGAHTVFLEPGPLKDKFPWLNVEDLGGGSWGAKDEGWFDSVGLMNGFRRGAKQNGAEYVENDVVDLIRKGDSITGVVLKTGETISCGAMVNAAGSRATTVAQMAGLSIPVEPRARHTFVFSSDKPIPGQMPNVIDLSGTFVRPEHNWFLSGNTPTPDGACAFDFFETKHDEFTDYIWPSLYHRIPQFDALRVEQFWTGHYAYNTLDHNAIVGPHDEVENFYFANGFSGHGLQQAPAVGRAISELILYGAFRTLDLKPLSFDRIRRNEPFLEEAVI